MATSKIPTCNGCYMPQLKIVLLGGRNSGKSSVGNLLLGKEEFVTNERTCCSRRLGLVAGRWFTVIDTPGWWCDMSSRETSRLVNREILNSVTLCYPGPHVFIIVVKASSTFTEQRRRAVEEHVQLLGEDIWTHCFLVLTFKDRWTLREAEKHVQRKGQEALMWLYNKCGQRCHSLLVNNEEGATKLIMKIQKMVTANGNTQFEMPENKLQRISDERRRVEERAHHRFKKMKQYRAKMRENLKPMSEIRIVLLGAKGSGKSSVFKTILGKPDTATHQSCTHTARNHVDEAAVFGRQVTIVDTPGWWCNFFSDETPIFDQRELVLSLSLSPPGPHAFLLVIRIDRAFSDTHRKSVEEHIELISHHIWSRVLVLFTFGDWLGGTTTEQYIESEGEAIQWVLDRCSNRYHVFNNKTTGDGFQVRELIGKIEEMVAGGGSEWYFEIEGGVIRNIKKKRREEMERAEERRRKKKEELREEARAHLECFTPFQELQIVLIGGSKTGKSSCGNTILSRNCFVADTNPTSCIENQDKVNGKTVTVLDTCSSYTVSSELFLASSAFLLVVNLSSAFKHVHLKSIEDQLDGVGPQIWRKAIVVFSFGDWLGDTSIEERIETEGHSLQTLVARCGNRYHVLDNRNRACTTQVNELIEYTEDIMAEERFQRSDHMTREVPLTQEERETRGTMDSNEKSICRNQLSHDLADSACAMPTSSGQIVTFSEERIGQQPRLRDRGALMSCLATFVSVKNRLFWTDNGQMLRVNVPIWSLENDLNGELFTPNTAAILSLPQAQSSMSTGENINPVHTLCHPMLINRTLRRLNQYSGLQALIDQWGDSSMQELEDFIDLYFEMVWEQTMHETHVDIQSTEEEKVKETEVLSSIDKKLSKLDLLEDIRDDLSELRKSLEQSMKAIEELKRQDKDET